MRQFVGSTRGDADGDGAALPVGDHAHLVAIAST
jgi:hypothetical protein